MVYTYIYINKNEKTNKKTKIKIQKQMNSKFSLLYNLTYSTCVHNNYTRLYFNRHEPTRH